MKTPSYFIGQLIEHTRYDYRGVVAGCDPICTADKEWYLANPTQPARDQPWYHVLVHGSEHSSYVAEENLLPYEGGEQVLHPLTRDLFESFARGRYRPRRGIRFPARW